MDRLASRFLGRLVAQWRAVAQEGSSCLPEFVVSRRVEDR